MKPEVAMNRKLQNFVENEFKWMSGGNLKKKVLDSTNKLVQRVHKERTTLLWLVTFTWIGGFCFLTGFFLIKKEKMRERYLECVNIAERAVTGWENDRKLLEDCRNGAVGQHKGYCQNFYLK